MAQNTSLFRISALALLLGGTAAQADVTAAQVWKDWQAYSATMGQTLAAGTEAMNGDTLTLSDVSVTMQMPDGSFTGNISEILMKDVGDGTVEITMSPEYPLVIKSKPAEGEAVEMTVVIKMPGNKMIASGSDTELGYAVNAPEIGVSMDGMMVDGAKVDLKVGATLKNVIGNYLSKSADVRTMDADFSAESMVYSVFAADPEGSGTFNVAGTMDAITSKSNSVLPIGVATTDMPAMLKAGFAVRGSLGYGKVSYDIDFQDPSGPFKGTGGAESGALTFSMDQNALAYGGGAKATTVSMTGAQIPFPVNVAIADTAFDLLMPIGKTDAPQDFKLLTKVVDLSVNDEIWALFDPTAVLPHDPATVIIDTVGTARWLFDIMDPAAAATAPEMPMELGSLTINQIQAKAAGADLTGNGTFTFDNTDMVTYPGMPKPVGKLNVQLIGANGLMDKLVQMGLLPEDQVMSARMMLGLFARPGEGEDSLVSEIEMGADGSVMANGQRLK